MANAFDDRLTGKASYIVIQGTAIPITGYSVSGDRLMTDKTNSVHYSPNTGLFSPAQVPVAIRTTVQAEGRFRVNTIPAAILSVLYVNAYAVPVILGMDANNVAGHGNFDITNFRTSVPVEGVISFNCTLTSNGPFYPNN